MKFNGSSNIRNIKRICMEKKLLEGGPSVIYIFGQAKSHNKFINGKSCQLFFNLVYGRMFQMNFQ